MYKRILLPYDGSDLSKKATKKGIAFAKSCGASVVGFYSPEDYQIMLYSEYVPPNLLTKKEFEAQAKRTAEKYLAYIKKLADDAGVSCETLYATSVNPWEAIIDAAKKKKCDLIFMASHGRRGIAGFLLGSHTQKVLTHSKIPVLVCR